MANYYYSLTRGILHIKHSYQPVLNICLFIRRQFNWFWTLFRMYTLLLLFNNALTIIVYASRIVNLNDTNQPVNEAYFSLNPFMDLARVLDIQPVFQHHHNNQFNSNRNIDASSTPDYFIKLYKSLTRSNGEGVGRAPYNADAIYGLMDSAIQNQRYYKYEIDEAINQRNILNSEFHLYRLRKGQNQRSRRSTGFLILKLYMVTSPSRKNTPFGNKLLDVKKVAINKYGWIIFNMREATKNWVGSNKNANHGLFVSVQHTDGSYPHSSSVVFAQKSMRHRKRFQPIMSVYTRQNGEVEIHEDEVSELSQAFKNRDPDRFQKIYNGEFYVPPVRVKRSENSNEENVDSKRKKHCALYPMNVDFDRMGWNQWIIGPRSFNAGVCSGPCPYPLGQSYHPTNHAVVQSIWYHLNPDNDIIGPVCCVPHNLEQLRILYYNNDRVVVLKTYDNMIVKSCGCK